MTMRLRLLPPTGQGVQLKHTHTTLSTPLLRHWFPKCFLRALASSPTLNPVDRAIAHQEATKMKTSCPRAWAPAPFLAQPSSAPLRHLLPLRSPSHLHLQQTCWVFIIWFQAGMMVSAAGSLGTEQAVGRQGFSPGPQCSTHRHGYAVTPATVQCAPAPTTPS